MSNELGRRTARGVVALAALGTLAAAQAPADPVAFASESEVRTQVATMEREMKPGQNFAWRALVRGGDAVAAIEIWKAPGRPAIHPDDAEYARVVAGSGTLVSGGRLIDPSGTQPGLIEGSRIEGGTTRRLRPGDLFMIPAGVPHWFGVDGRLVLLGTKLRQPAAGPDGKRAPN